MCGSQLQNGMTYVVPLDMIFIHSSTEINTQKKKIRRRSNQWRSTHSQCQNTLYDPSFALPFAEGTGRQFKAVAPTHIRSYAGIENGLEFENALASSQFISDSTNFSRDVLRYTFYMRLTKKKKEIAGKLGLIHRFKSSCSVLSAKPFHFNFHRNTLVA
jgi:hypothetical protein